MGVPWDEAFISGSMIGQKLILNEFVAYVDFVQIKDQLTEKTQVIITFALCGFANLSSVAILLGGLGGILRAGNGTRRFPCQEQKQIGKGLFLAIARSIPTKIVFMYQS